MRNAKTLFVWYLAFANWKMWEVFCCIICGAQNARFRFCFGYVSAALKILKQFNTLTPFFGTLGDSIIHHTLPMKQNRQTDHLQY